MSEDEHDPRNETLEVKIIGTLVLIFALIPFLVYAAYKAFQHWISSFPDDTTSASDTRINMIEDTVDSWA